MIWALIGSVSFILLGYAALTYPGRKLRGSVESQFKNWRR